MSWKKKWQYLYVLKLHFIRLREKYHNIHPKLVCFLFILEWYLASAFTSSHMKDALPYARPSCCQLAKWRFDPLQITKVWLASMDVNVVKVSVIKKYVCTWRINGCIKHKIPLCVKIVLLFRNIMWFFSLKRSKLHKSFTLFDNKCRSRFKFYLNWIWFIC